MDKTSRAFAGWWQRFACRLEQARRRRLARLELSGMSAYELRDMGVSHAAMATSAPRAGTAEQCGA
jgi:hypothetical protein